GRASGNRRIQLSTFSTLTRDPSAAARDGPAPGVGRPPAVLPFGIPEIADRGHHVLREARDVLDGEVVRHRAHLEEDHQVADPGYLAGRAQPFTDGCGATTDNDAR